MTNNQMETLARRGELCWGCDDAPTFEDSRYCESCQNIKCFECGDAPHGCDRCDDYFECSHGHSFCTRH